MAKPRIFLSSTYFDLKNVRTDLEFFIREQGYEAVLNERGHISYGKSAPLESYCYEEVGGCDILVSIIGGRYGSSSKSEPYSISQVELKTALESGKQVYIFIERDVFSEFNTYLKNKNNNIDWVNVDDEKIFKFIEEITDLPLNNTIFPFETSKAIVSILKQQWAGLFQRLLADDSLSNQTTTLRELNQGLQTVRQLVDLMSKGNEAGGTALQEVRLIDHPVFRRMQKAMRIPYRLFFTNIAELNDWLGGRSYEPVRNNAWDDPDVMEWIPKSAPDDKPHKLVKVARSIFDEDGTLKVFGNIPWDDNLVQIVDHDPRGEQESQQPTGSGDIGKTVPRPTTRPRQPPKSDG